jgi:hypothetical protein
LASLAPGVLTSHRPDAAGRRARRYKVGSFRSYLVHIQLFTV